jgi:hypothetical protein
MSYTTYDFSETIDGCGIKRDEIAAVEAAWGLDGDFAEWEGGFVIRLTSGKRLYITGWCDTTGWGCQDGTEIVELQEEAKLPEGEIDWDIDPADLNNFVKTGEGKWP